MIEFIALYVIFCITTAITCIFSFWNPVVREAQETGTNNSLVERRAASTFVYFCLAFAFAPVMFFILFSKSMSLHYIEGLKNIIKEPD